MQDWAEKCLRRRATDVSLAGGMCCATPDVGRLHWHSSTHQVGTKILQVHELDSHHLVQRNALGQPDLHCKCRQDLAHDMECVDDV